MSRTHHHSINWGTRHFFKQSKRIGPTPGWWIRLMMHVPRRRQERDLMLKVVRGELDAEGMCFGVGGRKPHTYFW